MSSSRYKPSSPSENGCPGSPLNHSTVAFLPEKWNKEKRSSRINYRVLKIVLAALPVLLLLTIVIVLLILLTRSESDLPKKTGIKPYQCRYSDEAKRVGLDSFLDELVWKYFELVPEEFASKPGVTGEEIRRNFLPYDPRPNAIKNYTDGVRRLHDKLEVIIGKANGSLLKLRENKAMYLGQQFLLYSITGGPYSRDYYAGDWMFEPNLYCWQPICDVLDTLSGVIYHFQPRNLSGIEAIEELLKKHNETFSQYIENLKLGVKSGMVRSEESCKAGILAIKRKYYEIAVNKASGIFDEDVGKAVLNRAYTAKITSEMNETWYKRRGEGVHESLKRFLLDYLGEPLTRLIRYLETEHIEYCYQGVNGMANLPLTSVYVNGVRDSSQPTHGKLPNGDAINITYSYTKLLPFFTRNGTSPEELKEMGYKKLQALLDEAKDLAKQYTGIEDVNTAVSEFRKILHSRSMFFNDAEFPANESGDEAFMKCVDAKGAGAFCPVRWRSLQKWINYTKETASFIKPKIKPLFYGSTSKKTIPNCGISVKGEYNPTVCFHGYEVTVDCQVSAFQTLPFFMNNFGPKYTEYTTSSHEQLPGHHLEVQGYMDNFGDNCEDVISWISSSNFVAPFTEGWATYVEYPLMAKDTDIYSNTSDKNVLLQKYGMLKYQILAALRSVLDTGVNYFKMTRNEAKKHFDEYAWDKSDLADKDITRYQSSPALVTSYMIGQETFMKLREQAERELGASFSLKEFHYQLLRQGEIPLGYMEIHISRFIECKKNSSKPECEEILS